MDRSIPSGSIGGGEMSDRDANHYVPTSLPDPSSITGNTPAGMYAAAISSQSSTFAGSRRTLTAASSSGSDPLASPSNEAISDIEGPMLDQALYVAGALSGMPSNLTSAQRMSACGVPGVTVVTAVMQAQLHSLEKQYQIQKDILNRQFEEQRRILEQEQQTHMNDYIKKMMLQRKQEELCELQQLKLAEEEQRMKERWEQIKHKRKDEESAVASTAVKLKLRECLLNKSHRELRNSGDSSPEFRQWSTQHSSLEQHSPPTNTDWSPPLHLVSKFEEEYPLRKTVSEPSLKMRNSKLSLRQKVMQRNSLLSRRREMYRKRIPLTVDHDDSPNSPPTVVSSQGSSVDMGVLEEEPRCLDHQIQVSGNNYSNPDISGERRHLLERGGKPSPPGMSIAHSSDAELKRVRSGHYDHSHPGSSFASTAVHHHDYHPYPIHAMGGVGGLHYQSQMESANLTEAYVQALMLARSALPRTRSEPIPLPVQLLLQQHQLLLQKQQEQLQKENNKLYLKQKLLHNAGVKKFMENVDESVEARLQHEMTREDSAESVDVIVVDDTRGASIGDGGLGGFDDPSSGSPGSAVRPLPKSRKAFLDKIRARTLSGNFPTSSSVSGPSAGGFSVASTTDKPSLERGHSCPTTLPARRFSPDTASKHLSKTGVVYDPTMLKHACVCQNTDVHPEHPGRLIQIWARLEESGLIDRCTLVKSRRATREELQTCHSEAYVQMYGSSQRRTDPLVFERFVSRFCRLPCGGIGVDSDTVWNEQYTTMAARVAAGSVIELSFKVALGEVDNGFAVVRPPGHHADDTQAMGFCYFNSIGVATKLLLERLKLKRILIVDWDVHHGNSTQQLFYADPRVLYISLHRHDEGNFFPGTGFPGECGIERGLGYNINIAWSGASMGDAEYMAAFRTIVMPIARDYHPELVLVSAGFDAAAGHPNPLGGYIVSPQCFGHMTQQLMTLSERRLVLVLEGGYEIAPLVESTEICLRALLDEQIESPSESELYRSPYKAAVDTLACTIRHQLNYWPCLARYTQSLSWSYLESQHRMKEEAETVSAFAGLSVMAASSQSNCIQERPDSTTADIAEEQEPMEDA